MLGRSTCKCIVLGVLFYILNALMLLFLVTSTVTRACVEGTNIDRTSVKLWLHVAKYVDILANNEIGVNRVSDAFSLLHRTVSATVLTSL